MEEEAESKAEAVFSFFQEAEVEAEAEAKRHCFHITAFEPLDGLSSFKKSEKIRMKF